jgi:hypothetical protein
MRQLTLSGIVGVVAAWLSVTANAADDFKLPLALKIAAGDRERNDALATFAVPASLASARTLRLIETIGGREVSVPVQFDQADSRLWWVASRATPAGSTRTYRLEQGTPTDSVPIKIVDSDRTVEAVWEGQPLLRYNKAHIEPAAGVNPRYGRSAHLHPVWTTSGAIVTDELPPDHLHQSGIFLSYTKTQFEGRDVDFWNLGGGKGRVRFKSLTSTASGPVFGQIRAVHEHVDLTAGGDKSEIGKTTSGKVALTEAWDLRIWNVGQRAGIWMFDVNSAASCASDSLLELPEYHYGGMAIRAAREWTPQHVQFLTSEGDERIKGNHTRPKWCDIHGLVDGKYAGVTMLTHPSNFRFPEPLRIHPTMPYMVYTPSFLGDWQITPGTPHVSRYRFIIHASELSAETLHRLWQDFAEPLVATAN